MLLYRLKRYTKHKTHNSDPTISCKDYAQYSDIPRSSKKYDLTLNNVLLFAHLKIPSNMSATGGYEAIIIRDKNDKYFRLCYMNTKSLDYSCNLPYDKITNMSYTYDYCRFTFTNSFNKIRFNKYNLLYVRVRYENILTICHKSQDYDLGNVFGSETRYLFYNVNCNTDTVPEFITIKILSRRLVLNNIPISKIPSLYDFLRNYVGYHQIYESVFTIYHNNKVIKNTTIYNYLAKYIDKKFSPYLGTNN